jgi:hypothetical protein
LPVSKKSCTDFNTAKAGSEYPHVKIRKPPEPGVYTGVAGVVMVREEYQKAVILENEIEARLLDSILTERDIPHIMASYYDTAYDGLYQTQKGWGYISAPPAFHEEIQEIISSVRKESNLPDGS